jgi:hypothetical protein
MILKSQLETVHANKQIPDKEILDQQVRKALNTN